MFIVLCKCACSVYRMCVHLWCICCWAQMLMTLRKLKAQSSWLEFLPQRLLVMEWDVGLVKMKHTLLLKLLLVLSQQDTWFDIQLKYPYTAKLIDEPCDAKS